MFRFKNKNKEPAAAPVIERTSADHLRDIMGRGIDWFDYEKMSVGERILYYNDAKFIIENEAFNNELHHFISDMIKFCAMEAGNYDQILHVRSAIVALDSFKDRLKSIKTPFKEETHEEINEAI